MKLSAREANRGRKFHSSALWGGFFGMIMGQFTNREKVSTKMKKLMAICGSVVAMGVFAETNAPAALMGWARLAPFSQVTAKAATLGQAINNPMLPTMALGTAQQQMAQTYGRFRSDAAVYWLWYDGGAGKPCREVLMYPSVDGPAKLLLKHAGSKKREDGTLHLLPAEGRHDDSFVKFTEDGTYCTFADSPAMAAQAVKDFEAARKSGEFKSEKQALLRGKATGAAMQCILRDNGSLSGKTAEAVAEHLKSRLELDGKDVTAEEKRFTEELAAVMKKRAERQRETFAKFRGAEVALDIDEKGLSADVRMKFDGKDGAEPLPAGVMDAAPKGAVAFVFTDALSYPFGYENGAQVKGEMGDVAKLARAGAKLLGAKKWKHAKLAAAAAENLAGLCEAVAGPKRGDWYGAWAGCDGKKLPYMGSIEKRAGSEAEFKAKEAYWAKLGKELEAAFPGSKMVTKAGEGDWRVALGAVIDTCAVESGVDAKDKKQADELAKAKENVKKALGGLELKVAAKKRADGAWVTFAGAGAAEPAAGGDGEARLKAALPETAAERPAAAGCVGVYSMVREMVLPALEKFASADEKFASAEEKEQLKLLTAALPPATANSTVAGAKWAGKDGSARVLVRVTTDELKNFGAAFNSFTAASMGAAADDDDED